MQKFARHQADGRIVLRSAKTLAHKAPPRQFHPKNNRRPQLRSPVSDWTCPDDSFDSGGWIFYSSNQ
jgi:hypothetical protein